MRIRFTVTGALLLAAAACGGSATGAGSTAPSSPSSLNRATPTRSPADYKACTANLNQWLIKLEEVDSRLSIGMTEPNYLSAIGGVKVEYDQVDFKALPMPCIAKVGLPAEKAMNAYIQAANLWSHCISNFNCSMSQVKPRLQAKWATASLKIETAKAGMDRLKP